MLLIEYIHTLTIVTNLFVSFRTQTAVTSPGVNTYVLAEMFSSFTFIQIPAGHPVGIEEKTACARTYVAPFCILAVVLTR